MVNFFINKKLGLSIKKTCQSVMDILVINLDRDTERLKNVERQLDDFTRIAAVDSKKVRGDCSTSLLQLFGTKSMAGIMMSHMKCWRYIVENNLDYALILEDDFKLSVTEKELVNYSNKLVTSAPSSWDVILLGYFMGDFVGNDLFTKIVMRLRNIHGEQKDINRYLFKPSTWGGAHGYLLSQRGAQKLINTFPKATYHVDFEMARLDFLNVYASKRKLVFQNISGKGSHNAYEIPILKGWKMDHNEMDLDFFLSMPALQVLGLEISLWTAIQFFLIFYIISLTRHLYF